MGRGPGRLSCLLIILIILAILMAVALTYINHVPLAQVLKG